jgi:hypothetical protein
MMYAADSSGKRSSMRLSVDVAPGVLAGAGAHAVTSPRASDRAQSELEVRPGS